MTYRLPINRHLTQDTTITDTSDWPRCDITLIGIAWISEDCCVQFKLKMPNLDRYLVMNFDWISKISIDLDTTKSGVNNASPPMTWDVIYTKTEDNRWTLHFDFASDGQITLECGLVTLEVSKEKCF